MRILHVTESLGRGGAERSLVDRVRLTQSPGVAHHVVGLYRDDALASEVRSVGASVTFLGGTRPRHIPGLFKALVDEVRRFRPDAVHTQLLSADLAGRAASFFARTHVVVSTLQNLPYDLRAANTELGAPTAARLLRIADWASLRLARGRLIAVSDEVRRSYSQALRVPLDGIAVIPNGVDTQRLAPRSGYAAVVEERRRLAVPSDRYLIVSVARLVPQKGLRHLVAALALPPLNQMDVALVIAGDGPLRDALLSQARQLDVQGRVSLIGRIDRVDMLLASADVFVLPSIYEGLPLALLEAMALGVPALASDLPELRELALGDCIELTPARDERAIAETLARLLTDPLHARRLAVRGRQRVADAYDAKANANRFLGLIRAECADRR